MVKSWILLGMPGSGKSSIGRALAARTGRTFFDTDMLIERRLGRRVSAIFRLYGEDAFRDHEAGVLRAIEPAEAVLATGGGIVIRDENWREMRRIGITAFLDVEPQVLADRLETGRRKRPLLSGENWQDRLGELCGARRTAYLQADLHLVLGDLEIAECVDLAQREFLAAEQRALEPGGSTGSDAKNPTSGG